MRLFIATPVPASPAFFLAIQGLQRVCPAAQPVPGGSWHITLRFLGDVDDPQPAAEAMQSAVAGVAAIPAIGRGVGAFPNLTAARVAWASVEAPGLGRVAERVRDLTRNMGKPPDADDFVPHITLARLRNSCDLQSWAEHFANTVFFEGKLEHVVLFSSKLTNRGPVYRAESVAALGQVTAGS